MMMQSYYVEYFHRVKKLPKPDQVFKKKSTVTLEEIRRVAKGKNIKVPENTSMAEHIRNTGKLPGQID